MVVKMRNKLKIYCLLVVIGCMSYAHADQMPATSGVIAIATEPASVKTVSLEGKVIGRTGGVGLPIYLNDEIKTGAQNRLQILLKDQSVFNIGPNSSLTIDKFVFDPTRPELSVNIQRGTFKFVSGKISNGNPEAMKVKLPNATIAVRGTGVAGEVAANGASTVVLLHGTVDVSSTAAGASSTATLSKSGWGVQIGSAGNVSAPSLLPSETVNGILQKVGRASAAGAVVASSGNSSSPSAAAANAASSVNQSNSGLSAADLSNSVDASQFVSSSVAQSFKNQLLASINTQTALNGNEDMLSAQVLNDVIRNNPSVWAGILEAFGMPANTPIPESQKQDSLSQFINSEFAKYYALLVFPKIYTPTQIQTGAMGPLGTVTFNASNIPMSCTVAGACGTNASAMINSQSLVLNYTAAQMTNTFNVSYSNFYGITGSASGTASSPFSALQVPGGGGPAPQLNVYLPGTNPDGKSSSGTGGTTLSMVGQFGSIGNLVGKWSTLTTSLGLGSNPAQMRAGYQVKGQ
jgi:hypothetical protein